MLSSLHNPKNHRYAPYYFAVLLVVTIAVAIININVVNLSPVGKGSLIFEGYFSLFMLVRNEEIGKAFLFHISSLKNFLNRSLFFS